jgi:hypothetical protein
LSFDLARAAFASSKVLFIQSVNSLTDLSQDQGQSISKPILGIQQKGLMLGGRVDMVVILKLCEGKEVGPIINEEPEILLEFLVHSFSLPIPLWVIGHGGCQLNFQEPVELTSKLGHKMRASVGHDSPRQAVMLPDVLYKQPGSGRETKCGSVNQTSWEHRSSP